MNKQVTAYCKCDMPMTCGPLAYASSTAWASAARMAEAPVSGFLDNALSLCSMFMDLWNVPPAITWETMYRVAIGM